MFLYQSETVRLPLVLLGVCIRSTQLNSSELKILNNLSESACIKLDGPYNNKTPVIRQLQIQTTCVNGSDVRL